MKRHPLFSRHPFAARLLTCVLAGSLSVGSLSAQTPVLATDPDLGITNTFNGATLSTAMIEHLESERPISVIAYSSFDKMGFYVQYGSSGDKFDTFEDTRWSAVDVAIIDDPDPSALGEYYYVGVVYKVLDLSMTQYDLKLKVFRIRVASGTVSVVSGGPVSTLDLATVAITEPGNLRIDAVASMTQDHGPGIPVMDRFMVLYPDPVTSTMNIREVAPDLSLDETYEVIPNILAGKDIAVSVDRANGFTEAYIGSVMGNDLYVLSYRMYSPAFSYISALNGSLTGNVYTLSSPRIEAFGLLNPGSNDAKWAAVADIGTMHDSIMVYTDQTLTGQKANPTMGFHQEYPTIAAGIGPTVGSRSGMTGNRQYGFAWGNTHPTSMYRGNYFSNYLDYQGVLVNPTVCRYVNRTPGPLGLATDPGDQISMSNSANSGLGMLTAWVDGRNVMYKVVEDGDYRFRPDNQDKTGIEGVLSLTAAVYPNPAQDHFIIQDALKGSPVSVVNSLGQVVLRETILSNKTRVDVSALSPGIYHVDFTDNGGKQTRQKLVLTQ